MQKNDLPSISSLFNNALRYAEIDYESSLILIRKTLEKIIKAHYEIKDIEPPKNEEGFTVLSNMIDDLKSRRILSAQQKNQADFVRRLGNNAAHYTDVGFTKKEVNKSITYLSALINDLLRKQKLVNNSLFLLTLRRANLTKKIKVSQSLKKNQKDIKDLLNYSYIKHYYYVAEVYNDLDDEFFIDEELYEYVENVGKFLEKFYKWDDEFDPNDYRGTWDSIKSLFGLGGHVSSAKTFRGYYWDRIQAFEEQKKWIKKKYNF